MTRAALLLEVVAEVAEAAMTAKDHPRTKRWQCRPVSFNKPVLYSALALASKKKCKCSNSAKKAKNCVRTIWTALSSLKSSMIG